MVTDDIFNELVTDEEPEDTGFDSVMSRMNFLKGVYENKKSQEKKLTEEVAELTEEKEVLDKSEKVLKHLADKLVEKDLAKMDALITYGLKTVYADRDIRFKSEIINRGKKIWIDLKTIYNGSTLDKDSMSSVHVVESFLLRLMCIIKLKRSKVLLLDETFAALDPGYIENLSQLIVELCKKLGMDIFLVTHNNGFDEFVKHSYKISNKNDKTELVRTK